MNYKNIKIPSNRNFGIVFFVVFFLISIYPMVNNESIRFWSLIISLIFLILAILNSKILTPFNKLWFKLGIFLGAIVAPIVMAFVFFLVVTPIGLFMRLLGKDLLYQKINKSQKSYWVYKSENISSMNNQF